MPSARRPRSWSSSTAMGASGPRSSLAWSTPSWRGRPSWSWALVGSRVHTHCMPHSARGWSPCSSPGVMGSGSRTSHRSEPFAWSCSIAYACVIARSDGRPRWSSRRRPSARASSRCRWRTSCDWPVARKCQARSSAVCAPDTGTSVPPFGRRPTCDDQSHGRGSGSHRVLRHDGADPESGRGARDVPAPLFPGVACYVAGVYWLPASAGPRAVAAVLTVGVIARLVLLPVVPTLSTDVYRYVWDARVAHAGISPYAYPPSAREIEPLRDLAVFPHLNHPTWRTIYPPAAQTFFRLVYHVRPDSVSAMKLAVGLAELIGLATVAGLLRAGGRPLSNAAIYAWNPLVLIEVWGMGHLDGLLVPAVTGAAWMALRGRHAVAGALLGGGMLLKLYPATLLALLPTPAWAAAVP